MVDSEVQNFTGDTLKQLIPESERLPAGDRKELSVRPPPQRPLSLEQVVSTQDVNLEILKAYLIEYGCMSKELIKYLITKVRGICHAEPNTIKLEGDVVIIGDIHGQFMDMMGMFKSLKRIPGKADTKFLFLGDYVDRGELGVEVMGYLLALKLKYPEDVTLLRGNHETEEMTSQFNFRSQVLERYDQEIYTEFIELFQALPIAAVVNGKFLCVHGGISPRIADLKAINKVDRFREPPDAGVLVDVLWADPFDEPKEARKKDFSENDLRKVSVCFGLRPAKALLKREKLESIVRAHQVKPQGFELHYWEGNFPTVITIFSAPNYEQMENNGAVLISTAQGGLDVRPFHENREQLFPFDEENQNMLSLMQFRLSASVFQMFTSVLEYGARKAAPSMVKSLSQEQNIDWEYLKRVIERSKEEKKDINEKIALKINLKKRPNAGKHSGKQQVTVDTSKDLTINTSELNLNDSDDEDLISPDQAS